MVRSAAACCLALACTAAQGGLVFGTDAMDFFGGLHASLGGVYLDFEDKPAGTNLMPGQDPWGVGARFASIINTSGQPFGPEHVEVSNRHHPLAQGNTIVGSPFAFGGDDGRVGYEIVFDETQGRAGIERVWNTSSLTRFYNEAGELLAEHQNTVNTEFVGWFAEAVDGSDRVKRIVMDGLAPGGTRQVGYSDNLYFGLEIPAPGALALVVLGAITAGGRGRGRAG